MGSSVYGTPYSYWSGAVTGLIKLFRLCYVPPDIIAFARELGFQMKVPLESRANFVEVLELPDVIEETEFNTMPEKWCDHQSRAMYYHPGWTRRGADYIFYHPWCRHKIDETSACMRA